MQARRTKGRVGGHSSHHRFAAMLRRERQAGPSSTQATIYACTATMYNTTFHNIVSCRHLSIHSSVHPCPCQSEMASASRYTHSRAGKQAGTTSHFRRTRLYRPKPGNSPLCKAQARTTPSVCRALSEQLVVCDLLTEVYRCSRGDKPSLVRQTSIKQTEPAMGSHSATN